MTNTSAAGIYVIAATKGSEVEYWAAAAPRDQALDAVQLMLAPGWTASAVTERNVTPDQVAALNLHPGDVRKL
jgi:hypothetical protein